MKKDKLAFILSIISGVICLSVFIYKLMQSGKTDYVILLAGIFIISIGMLTYFRKGSN